MISTVNLIISFERFKMIKNRDHIEMNKDGGEAIGVFE
jgi:hypothetical protein